jgi:hypothetical protein
LVFLAMAFAIATSVAVGRTVIKAISGHPTVQTGLQPPGG